MGLVFGRMLRGPNCVWPEEQSSNSNYSSAGFLDIGLYNNITQTPVPIVKTLVFVSRDASRE